MNIPKFHSPEIKANLDELVERGKEWLDELGSFNEDLRNLELLLRQLCVPDFKWDCMENGVLSLNTYENQIWWDDHFFRFWFLPKGEHTDAKFLGDCGAYLRREAKRHNWLGHLAEEAIEELKKAQEHFAKE